MKKAVLLLIFVLALTSCAGESIVTYGGDVPELRFLPVTHTADGTKCFYLFDDNPEHLNENFLADGETPSSIAHFEGLKKGVYTIFSYHHRGTAAESEEDLFFDVLFSGSGVFKITRLGLDHDWQWNNVWADFTGEEVFAPEIINSSGCTCARKACGKADGECIGDCTCADKNVRYLPENKFSGLSTEKELCIDRKLLSEIIPEVEGERINEIRHGGYNEPIWLMIELEILSGEITVDTIAYKDKQNCNFDEMKAGRVADEPQYKGLAESAPIVRAELSYVIEDEFTGPLPIKIVNQKHPEGIVTDGEFATNVNTWKNTDIISAESAESDLLALSYIDAAKAELYGEAAADRDSTWHFDPYHTKLYSGTDSSFVPNGLLDVGEYYGKNESEFYKKYVLNLGNFGVRYIYEITLENLADKDKLFCFSLSSVSGHVYKYALENDGKIAAESGKYIVKKFDNSPAKKAFSTESKPQKYTSGEELLLCGGRTYKLTLEVVTLTGCDAPLTNIWSIK